ncbi:FtsX-like permease family protein [Roseivirga sp. BDSF3-8]|uniref:FtsX-like permease family protein n=1 Tax=Roseivirga sp. BDSF3-8 TaxID=3241598 RepID=UPI0035323AD4
MKLPLFIARKYFLSGKKKTFINVISIISMLAVMTGSAALIIVLSVFNGLEGLIRSLYDTFDPELKVTAVEGKTFSLTDSLLTQIDEVEGVRVITQVVEDNAYVRYRDSEMVVTVKGVSDNFLDQHRLDDMIVQGEMKLYEDGINYAIIGRGIQNVLSISPSNDFYALQVFYPKKGRTGNLALDPSRLTNRKNIMPGAVFAIEKQFDEQFIFVPLDFAEELMEYGDRRTSLEIQTTEEASVKDVQAALKELLGEKFQVYNSDEQHSSLLKAIKVEKLFVYVTFFFILAIASFNIFFSLTMLALDKKEDIKVLYAMGANDRLVRNIFLTEGGLISFLGAALGLFIGYSLCYLQSEYGMIGMGMQTSILEAYPVKMEWIDFVLTAASIIFITYLASFRPAGMATRFGKNLKF